MGTIFSFDKLNQILRELALPNLRELSKIKICESTLLSLFKYLLFIYDNIV